jgi:cold shock CspA family protein
MKRGKLLFFTFTLGYGFITDSETGEDIFVKKKSLIDKHLTPGDDVEYEFLKDSDDQVACNVKLFRKKSGNSR